MDKNELESKKIAELKDIAKSSGVEGFQSMKKADLVASLSNGSTSDNTDIDDDKPKRKRTLKNFIQARA